MIISLAKGSAVLTTLLRLEPTVFSYDVGMPSLLSCAGAGKKDCLGCQKEAHSALEKKCVEG